MRPGPNIYELRSYQLKAGTMIEWGNNWARGIQYRMANDEPFAGFFTQIGPMFTVHHIWGKSHFLCNTLTWAIHTPSAQHLIFGSQMAIFTNFHFHLNHTLNLSLS